MPQFFNFTCSYSAKPELDLDDEIGRTMCSSKGLAWLPAEFYVNDDDIGTCNINSLHPEQHSEMYLAIDDVFSFVLLLFEHLLGELGTSSEFLMIINGGVLIFPLMLRRTGGANFCFVIYTFPKY